MAHTRCQLAATWTASPARSRSLQCRQSYVFVWRQAGSQAPAHTAQILHRCRPDLSTAVHCMMLCCSSMAKSIMAIVLCRISALGDMQSWQHCTTRSGIPHTDSCRSAWHILLWWPGQKGVQCSAQTGSFHMQMGHCENNWGMQPALCITLHQGDNTMQRNNPGIDQEMLSSLAVTIINTCAIVCTCMLAFHCHRRSGCWLQTTSSPKLHVAFVGRTLS